MPEQKPVKRQIKRLWKAQSGLCWLCDQPLGIREATRDHVVPRSKGGGNASNIKLAHEVCNKLRGNLDAEVARAYVIENLPRLGRGKSERAMRVKRILRDMRASQAGEAS